MNPNYLEYKKEQVRYWSKISSLALTFLLPIIKIIKQPLHFNQSEEWQELPSIIKVFLLLMVLVGLVIGYYLNYYVISSIFWPERLSLFNWVLLVPCEIGLFMEVKGLLEK